MNDSSKVLKKLVNKKEAIEALEYLYGSGAIEQMSYDQKFYTEVLIRFTAERLNIELV